MRLRARTALLVAGLATTMSTSAPAFAEDAECFGVAPVGRPTCMTTGHVGSSLQMFTGPSLGFTGTVTVKVSTVTYLFERTDTYQAGLLVSLGTPSISGSFQTGQFYGLYGSANGVGHFTVSVSSP